MRIPDLGRTFIVLSPSVIGVYPCKQDDVGGVGRNWTPTATIGRLWPWKPEVRLAHLFFVARWSTYG